MLDGRRNACLALLPCLVWLAACGNPERATEEASPEAAPSQAAPAVEAKRAAVEPLAAEHAPASLDFKALEQGRADYARICAVCHGANGEGYKADNAPALNHPGCGSPSTI
jgi:mono/diheme cytochrome c family protein